MYCGGHALAERAREAAERHPESRMWEFAQRDPVAVKKAELAVKAEVFGAVLLGSNLMG